MKFIKQVAVSLALVCASLAAQAADYNVGTLNLGYNGFGPNAVAQGSFLDKINFTLSADANTGYGVGALSFSVGGAPILNISNLALSLFDSNDVNLGSGLDFTVNALQSGNYYLQVTGNSNGLLGGMYAGGIEVSAVPEPGSLSLLLSGLAMFGLMAFRRRDSI